MISIFRVSLFALLFSFSSMSISHSDPTDNPVTGNVSIISHTYSTIFDYGIRVGEQSLTNLSNLGISYDDKVGWEEISYSSFDHLGEDGSLSTIFISGGIDFPVSNKVVLGIFGQFDITNDEYSHDELPFTPSSPTTDADLANVRLPAGTTTADSEVSGLGWLVGPYAIMDLEAGIRLSGKLGYGQSSDEIKPYGTYTDDIELGRFLATGRLSSSGYSSRAGWAISPSLEYMYYGIDADEYRDSTVNMVSGVVGNLVPSMEHSITRVDFGPTFSRNFGKTTWNFGIKGSWSRWDSSSNGVDVNEEDIRIRTNMGINYVGTSGVRFNFGGYYDNIFSTASYGATVGINYNF